MFSLAINNLEYHLEKSKDIDEIFWQFAELIFSGELFYPRLWWTLGIPGRFHYQNIILFAPYRDVFQFNMYTFVEMYNNIHTAALPEEYT